MRLTLNFSSVCLNLKYYMAGMSFSIIVDFLKTFTIIHLLPTVIYVLLMDNYTQIIKAYFEIIKKVLYIAILLNLWSNSLKSYIVCILPYLYPEMSISCLSYRTYSLEIKVHSQETPPYFHINVRVFRALNETLFLSWSTLDNISAILRIVYFFWRI